MPKEYFGFLRGCTPDTQNFLSAIPLDKVFKIGRDKDSDLIINAKFITGTHCEIRSAIKEDGIFVAYITDKSINGTYINGCLIGFNKTVTLYPNSILQFGSQHLRLVYIQSRNHDINDFYKKNFHVSLYRAKKKENYSIYVTRKSIGSGAQGDILLSYVANRQRFQLACKRYRTSGLYRSPQIEIEMLKANKHINVLSIIREFTHARYIHTLQPLYVGGTLSQRIDSRHTMEDEKDVFVIFHQIVQGLQYIHKRGVIHCDLKADNILLADLSSRPRIIITDFGLSIYSKSENIWPEDYGTLVYHSPEIVVNEKPFTEKVDCWAAGVILYQMLAKTHPFLKDKNLLANPLVKSIIKNNILNEDPDMELIKQYSKEVKLVISKLLTKDPDNRYSTSDCISSPWALMNYDEVFYKTYHEIKMDYLKERALWFQDEDGKVVPKYKERDVKYHIDDDKEQVAALIERRGKSEEDPDSVFHRSTPASKIYNFYFDYINTQLNFGRRLRSRKAVLGNKSENLLFNSIN